MALGSTSQYITEESQSRDSSIDPEARTKTGRGGVLLTGLFLSISLLFLSIWDHQHQVVPPIMS